MIKVILAAVLCGLSGVARRFDPPSRLGYEVVAAPAARPAALFARPAVGTEIGRSAHGRFWVIRRRGAFLGISTLQRHDNRLAWIRADAPRLRFSHTWLMAHVDLSAPIDGVAAWISLGPAEQRRIPEWRIQLEAFDEARNVNA